MTWILDKSLERYLGPAWRMKIREYQQYYSVWNRLRMVFLSHCFSCPWSYWRTLEYRYYRVASNRCYQLQKLQSILIFQVTKHQYWRLTSNFNLNLVFFGHGCQHCRENAAFFHMFWINISWQVLLKLVQTLLTLCSTFPYLKISYIGLKLDEAQLTKRLWIYSWRPSEQRSSLRTFSET